MKDEKIIAEMAKIMQKCYEKNGLLNFKWFAESAYKYLTKDNVVFPKSEYDKLQTENKRLFYQNCNLKIENKNLEIEILKSKETAEKAFKITKKIIDKKYAIETPWTRATLSDIISQIEKEFAKQLNVEIKE